MDNSKRTDLRVAATGRSTTKTPNWPAGCLQERPGVEYVLKDREGYLVYDNTPPGARPLVFKTYAAAYDAMAAANWHLDGMKVVRREAEMSNKHIGSTMRSLFEELGEADELYELALRALTTPSLDASAALAEIQTRHIAGSPEDARDWAEYEARPKFIDFEGSWPVEIVDVEERETFRSGPIVVVRFTLATSPRVYAYVIRLMPDRLDRLDRRVVRFQSDVDLEPVLKAGRGRLETKNILTKAGRMLTLHTWNLR